MNSGKWMVAVMLAVASTTASAAFHLFTVEQVYSNADGTVQFIVLHNNTNANNEHLLGNHELISTGPGPTQTFTFPSNLPSSQTAFKRVLIATPGFAALGLVTPDYIIPSGFVQRPNGAINFADLSVLAYSNLPTNGVQAVNPFGAPIQNVATNFAGQSASVSPTAGPPPGLNVQGMWYAAPAESESGWGINFAHQGDAIFATWFTHDANGNAWNLSVTAFQTAPNTFTGTLVVVTGPPFGTVPFNPSQVQAAPVGTATLTFTDGNNGTFAYTVNGIARSKAITRQVFGVLPSCAWGALADLSLATNYTDMWWVVGGAESGWGINFTHQSNAIFATWFTFDLLGNPLPMSATLFRAGTSNAYSGTLVRTAGPPFSAATWNPGAVTRAELGTATVTFTSGNRATFAYSVTLNPAAGAVAQTKQIERQVFRAPGTACN